MTNVFIGGNELASKSDLNDAMHKIYPEMDSPTLLTSASNLNNLPAGTNYINGGIPQNSPKGLGTYAVIKTYFINNGLRIQTLVDYKCQLFVRSYHFLSDNRFDWDAWKQIGGGN